MAEKKTTAQKWADMTTVGKVTFVATTIGAITTALIGMYSVGAYGIDKIDARTERLVVASAVVEEKMTTVVEENAYNVVKSSLDRRYISSEIRSLKLELRIIQQTIRDYNQIEDQRPLSASEREELDELKDDRDHIKQEIKDLEDERDGLA